MTIRKNPDAVGSLVLPDAAWLARQTAEDIIEPGLPIVDPHHHLWHIAPHPRGRHAGHRYLLDDLLADTGSGHRVEATVFVDCMAFYRADGPDEMKPVGETEFANGVAAMAASGRYGPTRACAGIVSHADLLLGAAVQPVLLAHIAAGNGRFRGIRHAGAWDASPQIHDAHSRPPQNLYADPRFREGFAMLAPLGLSFEAWQYHPQLPEVTALARAFPDTPVVLNHAGGPLGVGPYAGRADEVRARWLADLRALATCPNVAVKVGGLGMAIGPLGLHRRAGPPTSLQIADAWRPWVEPCIELFGADRCMFESNFPVDKVSTGYAALWNAFKRLAAGASAQDKAQLFSATARRVYRL